jgi:hypothetical protein
MLNLTTDLIAVISHFHNSLALLQFIGPIKIFAILEA